MSDVAEANPGEMSDEELRQHYLAPEPLKAQVGAQTIVEKGRPMSSMGGALPQSTEDDQAGAARGARESAGRTPRKRAQPQTEGETPATSNPADMDDQQLAAHYLSGPQDNGVELMERRRLNRQDAFYRGSVAGSSRLAFLANIYQSQDPPDAPPERKAVNKQMRDEYVKIVSDLAAHDQMQPWGTTMEAMAAFGGQLEGTMISPESWLGWGAKGATWIGRTALAGAQQGAIQFATDPIVQNLNMSAKVQDEYDFTRTLLAGATGFAIGGTAHAIGEGLGKVIGQHALRKQQYDLGKEDPAFDAPRHEEWARDPNNGIGVHEGPREGVAPETGRATEGAEKTSTSQQTGAFEPEELKRIVPAVRDEAGQVYAAERGQTHLEAFDKVPEGTRMEDDGGFYDPQTKRYYTREQMTERMGPSEAVDLAKEQGVKPELKVDDFNPTPEAPKVEGFTTAKGSTYEVHEDGTTSRDKAARPEHPGEQGPQPRSESTFYVTPEDANKLGEFQTQGAKKTLIGNQDGSEWAVGYVDGPNAGKLEGRTRVQVQRDPAVGLIPVEVWKDGERVHFGNPITEVKKAEAAGVNAREIPPSDVQNLAQRRKGGKMEGEPERPAAGVPDDPELSPEKKIAVRSLQQQSFDLATALGFPLREGRVQSRKAAGQFAPRTGVVRVREVPDFDVVSHEAGHALESKIGADLTALTNLHDIELKALDYDQKARRVNEGFAEFMRFFISNPPEYLLNNAPNFYNEFRRFMADREPELLAKLDQAAVAYKAYLDAPSSDVVGSVVRSIHEEPTVVAKTLEAMKRDNLPGTINAFVQKVYDGLWDDKAPMTRMVRELAKSIVKREGRPLDLKAADNPEVLFRLAEQFRNSATLDLQYGVRGYHQTVPEGPSIADALASALGEQSWWGKYNEGKRKDFSAYLVARRAEYLWRKFEAGEIPNPPVAFSKADAVQAMADLAAVHPNFPDASTMVHDYTRQMLKKAYDGHLLKPDQYMKLLEDEFYVPFMRDVSDKPMVGSGMGQGAEGPGTTAIVKRLRGSARDIIDPLESIMSQTFLINRTLANNDVDLAMATLSRRAGPEGGRFVEPVKANELKMYTADLEQAIMDRAKTIGMDADEARTLIASLGGLEGDAIHGNYFMMERAAAKGEPIRFYREGGELKAHRVISKDEGMPIYELMMAAPPVVNDIWVNLVQGLATVKRASIITNPTFMISNYIRDQMAVAILRSDYVPFISGARGMLDEARQGQNAILYAYGGGVAGGRAVGVVDKAVEKDINALGHKGYSVTRVPTFKELMELASFTEAGTRNSVFGTVFEASKRKGLSDYEAMIEASKEAKDILDFSRHGSMTMFIRKFIPFYNAHMQGLDKARRTIIEPIVNRIRDGQVFERDTADFNNALLTLTKAGGVGATLGAVYAAAMADNEAYRDASPMVKGTHLVVPFGKKLIIVPKPFELSLGFTVGEYAFQQMVQKDPRAGRMLTEAAWDVLATPNAIYDLPFMVAPELALNKSLFTGRDIVPQEQQSKPKPQQFTDRTSELAKYIGKELNISPIKIDYAIGSSFATWGRDVMAASQGVNENSPAASLDDAALFRRFVKDPTRSSDVATRFWDYMGRTTGKFNQDVAGYNDMVKDSVTRGAPMTAANEFLAKLPAAERSFVTLKSAAGDDGKPTFKADERRLHPLQHAYDAVTLLNSLRKELATNAQMSFGGRQAIDLDPAERRDLLENVRELAHMEMRNSLVIMEEGGFKGRPMLDPNDTMAKIRAISPEVADEIATRYATAKVYKTDTIRKSWTKLRDDTVRYGSDADVRSLANQAVSEGYEFDGAKVRKPGVIRRPIKP